MYDYVSECGLMRGGCMFCVAIPRVFSYLLLLPTQSKVNRLVHIFEPEMPLQQKFVEIRKWVGFPYKVAWRYMSQAYENIRDKNNALSLYKNCIFYSTGPH